MKSPWTAVAICCLVNAANAALAGDHRPQELIDGMQARRRAVFSGQIDYHMKSGFRAKGSIIEDADVRFSFSGTSWALRVSTGVAQVVHDGKLLRYRETLQKDGRKTRTLKIEHPLAVNAKYPYPPFFAGSFWHDKTGDFVRDRANEARNLGEVRVNNVRSILLEWKIANPRQGFHGINDLLKDGGSLRVYVAPDLGFALPSYEYVAPDGRVVMRFDAMDFKEDAPSVFFPRRCELQTFDPAPMYYVEYTMTSVQRLNDVIPDEDFKLSIPVGTTVSDGRVGTAYRIDSADTPLEKELDDIVIESQAPARTWRRPVTAVAVGAVLTVILIALLLYLRRGRARAARQ
jgi:hypothetical protein